MIIISDCNKDIVIPAGLGDNAGVVYETAGVKSLNGETGDLKIKTVNGNDMLGEGNVAIDTGVESLNGQKGALTLKTVNGNELTGEGNIEIQAGSDIINLDGLTQEEVKAVYEKIIDQTKLPTFIYGGAISIYSYTTIQMPETRPTIEFYVLRAERGGMHLVLASVDPDGNIWEESKPQEYVNSLFINVNSHVSENADFECYYKGDLDYIKRLETRPNSYFIFFSNGIGDTTKPVFAPVSVIWDNNNFDGNSPFRIQFTANEKLYTYLHGDTDGKWLFESAKPIGGVQSSEVSNIKVLTQAEYDALTSKDENVLYCIKG